MIKSLPPKAVLYSSLSSSELIRECTESEETAAWEEFIRRFGRVISVAVLRTARRWGETAPALLDDLTQETYLKLCADHGRLLRNFDPHHPDAIFGFLKVLAANVANDHFKAKYAGKRGAAHTEQGLGVLEPAAAERARGSPETMEREILLKEIDVFLRTFPQRDRFIFWLYYRHGMTASAIASLPSIELTTKGVESTIHRLTLLVRTRMVEKTRTSKGFLARESL